jgi:hypothetical protein
MPMVNNGTINVLDGTIGFSSTTYTGNGAAVFNVAGASQVIFTNMAIAGTVRGTGTGTMRSAGTLTASGNVTLNTAQTFGLLGNLTATGPANSLTNAGSLSTAGAGNLTYTGVFTNAASGTWVEQSNARFFNSVSINNLGTMEIRDINMVDNAGTNIITNAGTLIKTTLGGAISSVRLTNTGVIDVQQGSFTLSGTFTQPNASARTLIRSGATLAGGAKTYATGQLEGRGSHNGNVTLTAATISPGDPIASSGTFNINGTLTMQPGSAIEIDVPAPDNPTSDRVIVSNQAAVAGTVVVNVPSGYNPPLGEVYEIIRSNTSQRTGTFTSLVINADAGITFGLTYSPTSVLLTVLSTNCDDIDFNNNDVYPEDQDVVDFFNVLAGGTPTTCQPVVGCNDVDFNNNNVFPEDQDVIDFFNVLAGGGCP